MKNPGILESSADLLGHKNAKCKKYQGKQVFYPSPEICAENMLCHKNKVSCLGIGKYLAPDKIGIGILHASGKRKRQHDTGCL